MFITSTASKKSIESTSIAKEESSSSVRHLNSRILSRCATRILRCHRVRHGLHSRPGRNRLNASTLHCDSFSVRRNRSMNTRSSAGNPFRGWRLRLEHTAMQTMVLEAILVRIDRRHARVRRSHARQLMRPSMPNGNSLERERDSLLVDASAFKEFAHD